MATRKTTTKIIDRKGKCIYAKISDINVTESHRVGIEVLGENKYTKKFNALKKSIKENGIFTPLLVKQEDDGTYTIIDGFRRYEVAKILEMKKIQVTVYRDLNEKEAVLGLITNANQKALTPIELGLAYERLLERKVYADKKELAAAMGLSVSTINSKMNNLKLDKRIIEDMLTGNGINDQKVLKALRGLDKADENKTSDKQWEAYSHMKENRFTREQALAYIKTLRENDIHADNASVEPVAFYEEVTESEIKVVIEKEQLDEETVSQIEALLEEVKRLSLGLAETEAA